MKMTMTIFMIDDDQQYLTSFEILECFDDDLAVVVSKVTPLNANVVPKFAFGPCKVIPKTNGSTQTINSAQL